jgi:hypothetical protein
MLEPFLVQLRLEHPDAQEIFLAEPCPTEDFIHSPCMWDPWLGHAETLGAAAMPMVSPF